MDSNSFFLSDPSLHLNHIRCHHKEVTYDNLGAEEVYKETVHANTKTWQKKNASIGCNYLSYLGNKIQIS